MRKTDAFGVALSRRSGRPEGNLSYRATVALLPKTIREDDRSVEFIAATERPVRVADYDRMEMIDEVLLMSGMALPANGQTPFLDNHERFSVCDVLGSMRQFRPENAQLLGRAFFSRKQKAVEAFQDVRDGHLTDVSVGYKVTESVWIPEGQRQVVNGVNYAGPLKVATRWELREVSLTPIGADPDAKARGEPKNNKEEKPMNPFNEWLVRGGFNPETLTEQQKVTLRKQYDEETARAAAPAPAKKPEPATPAAPAAAPADPEANRKAVEGERNRCSEIRALCAEAKISGEIEANLIKSGATIDEARTQILDHVLKTRKTDPVGGVVEMGQDDGEKFRAAAVDGILVRARIPVTNPAPGFGDFSNMGFADLARECLEKNGIRARNMTRQQLFEAALRPHLVIGRRGGPGHSTSDFAHVLGAANTKSLMLGWDLAEVTYPIWCRIGSLANFQAHKRVKLSDAPDLQTILDGQDVPQAAFSDMGETIQLGTKGLMVGIGRQALINDDLDAFRRIPMALTARARHNVNAAVYALLIANAAMGNDSIALFHATSHGANLASAGDIGDPSNSTLAKMEKVMFDQTGPKSTKLNIKPKFVLSGSYHKNTLNILIGSQGLAMPQYSGSVKNPWQGLVPVFDGNITGKKWFGAADQTLHDTVEVGFLDGRDGPTIEQFDANPFYLGVYNRVYLDYGVADLDYRALYQNPGE